MHCLTSKGSLLDDSSPLRHHLTIALAAVGGAGVDIFFVISGFIIMSLAERRLNVSNANSFREAGTFLLRRLGRVYPLYWVTLAVILAVSSFARRNEQFYHVYVSMRELFLLTGQILIEPPAWTLAFEVWFYVGTTLLMALLPRHFGKAVLVWALAQAGLLCAQRAYGVGPSWYVVTQPEVLDFFLGCWIGRIAGNRVLTLREAVALSLLAGAVFITGCAICYARLPTGSLFPGERLLYWGTSSALIIWVAISLELRCFLKVPLFLQRLGDYSYSIYLWHFPIMAISFTLTLEIGNSTHKLAQAGLEFLLTLALAPMSYRLIERPMMKVMNRITG